MVLMSISLQISLLCQISQAFFAGGFGLLSSTPCSQRRANVLSVRPPAAETEVVGKDVVHASSQRFQRLCNAMTSFNSTEASNLLSDINDIRATSPEPNSAINTLLDELLSDLAETNLPYWSKLRFLTRFSQRARLTSLRRTIDLVTPPPSEDATEDQKEEDLHRRKRRALLSLLRTLRDSAASNDFPATSKVPAIRQVEVRAVGERKSSPSTTDMIKRRPQDLETPNYQLIEKKKGFEIRTYDPYSVCSVSMSQLERDANPQMDAAVNEPAKGNIKAFGALAGYLFGKNQQEQAMKMTTPVLTTEDKRMSFVLPSEYWTDQSNAPSPLTGSGVMVEAVESTTRAVLLFGGYAVKIAERKKKLMRLVDNDKDWMVVPGQTPVLAQYNDPFTPPWKRLNEVSIAIQKRTSS